MELDSVVGTSKEDMPIQFFDGDTREQSIRQHLESLIHASRCKEKTACNRVTSCQKMKKVVKHTKVCKRKTKGDCTTCKQMVALCYYHAKNCQEDECSVPFCHTVRSKLNGQSLMNPCCVTQPLPFNPLTMMEDDEEQMNIEAPSASMATNTASQSKE